MKTGIGWSWMTAMAMLVAGCESYRPEPLRPANELATLDKRNVDSVAHEVRAVQESLALPGYHPEDGLDEAELVMVALAFNPDLRDRRYAAARIGETSLGALIHFRPEMKVSVQSATVGFATDSEVLYTLLVPSARAAWREADQARILQARAEMLAAESQLVAEVRRAHLAVRLAWQRQALIDKQIERRQHFAAALATRPPGKEEGLAAALVAWDLSEAQSERRLAVNALAAARRDLNRLLGFTPDYQPQLTALSKPLPSAAAPSLADGEIDRMIVAGRWELKALESQYLRDDFEVRRKTFEQFPSLRLGPALTYDRDLGTSFAFGATMRVPWPERSAEELDNARAQRDRARAAYVSKLHLLRADAYAANHRVADAHAEIVALERDLDQLAARAGELIEPAWRDGVITTGECLALLRQRCADERHLLDQRGEYLLARIDLDFATGRLNTIVDDPPARP
jgi:outer membrane protein TolC